MVAVDVVVEGVFQQLCHRYKHRGRSSDASMGLIELRVALKVTEAQFQEALAVLRLSGSDRIVHLPKNRVAMGPEWLKRCQRQRGAPGV